MNELSRWRREAQKNQKHCYTCGKELGQVRYECPTCYEWQCSEECRNKHVEMMDNV